MPPETAVKYRDRMTGEIEELDRGRLKFATDDAGTILFEWDKIAMVEATRQFEVTTSDGRRFLGSLGPSSARSVLIITVNDTISLSMSEVTGIIPMDASVWTRLEGSREEVNIAGWHAWVIGQYLRVIAEYQKLLEKYPNPKAVNMTKFGVGQQ